MMLAKLRAISEDKEHCREQYVHNLPAKGNFQDFHN